MDEMHGLNLSAILTLMTDQNSRWTQIWVEGGVKLYKGSNLYISANMKDFKSAVPLLAEELDVY